MDSITPLLRELLGEALRRERHAQGLTLADVADRSGVSSQHLSDVERGHKDPSSEVLAALAGALGLTVLDLVERLSGAWDPYTATEPSAAPADPAVPVDPAVTVGPLEPGGALGADDVLAPVIDLISWSERRSVRGHGPSTGGPRLSAATLA
jgi:transcriptional regulator with XRE-family HTH domain